ncbi:MAG: phosphopantetheine-binding protein [Nostoc sp.]|uniref:acyl carrier protein n=1 Tax=Nostoc sp. TaxID=1180 RepID=UPI002FEF09D1
MQETIKKILSEVKDTPATAMALSDDTDIINDIGLDSLQMVTFMLKLEEELNIEIDFDNLDFSTLMSVGNLCDFLSKQKIAS